MQDFLLIISCVYVLTLNASAQTFVRYVKPEDFGTKTLYADSVLTSITLPRGVARLNNYPKFNAAALELSQVLQDPSKELMQVWVCGSASPDGLWGDNVELSQARTDAAVAYIKSLMDIPDYKIHKESLNEDWERLYELVEASDIPCKYDVLFIIRTKNWGERKTALQKLDGGKVWKILEKDFFPQLRCVRFAIYCRWDPSKPYLSVPVEEVSEPVTVEKTDTVYIRDTVYYVKNTVYVGREEEPVTKKDAYEAYRSRNIREKKIYDTPWYMAVKTDLATDVLALPQAGLEIQLSRKVSLGFDGWYSEWAYVNPTKDFKVYGFRPDIRYYSKGVMEKGGFVGIHANFAWYTMMTDSEALYQNATLCKDENCSSEKHIEYSGMRYHDNPPAWSVGLTLGYLLPLDRNGRWALEFVTGLGYGQYSHVSFRMNEDGKGVSSENIVYEPVKGYAGITRVGVNLRYRFSVRPYVKQ